MSDPREPASTSRRGLAFAGGAVALAVLLAVVVRSSREPASGGGAAAGAGARTTSGDGPGSAADEKPAASAGEDLNVPKSRPAAAPAAVVSFGWGSGPGQIGREQDEEGHGETRLRVAAGADGVAYLLDAENGRVLRAQPDGGVGDAIRLPVKDPVHVAVAKDGSLALLSRQEGDGAKVTLTGPDGRSRATLVLPADVAKDARGVIVSGKDVYVESHTGEVRRVGDTSGAVDPSPALAPGYPTRDGKAFVTAILPSPESTSVHVFVVEREGGAQRWSRLVHPNLEVTGIPMADTDARGVVYLAVTGQPVGAGDAPEIAQLLCLEPTRGDLLGVVDLPLDTKTDTILDGKALDEGGVVLNVGTKSGVRVERHDCR